MSLLPSLMGFIGAPGPFEMIIIGVVAVLLFGKRLPEVGRSLGRSLIEFKKGMGDIQDTVNSVKHSPPPSSSRVHDIDDRDEATAPKFEPPKAAPQPTSAE